MADKEKNGNYAAEISAVKNKILNLEQFTVILEQPEHYPILFAVDSYQFYTL